MNGKKYIIGLILFTLFGVTLTAQQPFSQHHTVSNGLPSNAIYSLLEDREGFIWLTSEEGLFRYDGDQFKSYRTKEQSSYSGSGLIQDPLGRIWHQDFDGNSFYVIRETFQRFKQKNTAAFCPLQFTEKHVFLQEKNAICVADLKSLKILRRLPISNYVYATAVLEKEYVYAMETSLFSINADFKQSKLGTLPIDKAEFPILFGDGKSLFFTKKSGKENGVWKWENGAFKKLVSLKSDLIVQNAKIVDGKIYLLTTNGTYSFNPTNESKLASFFNAENASDLIVDRKGNYWLASNVYGIHVLPNINVQNRTFENFQPFRAIVYQNRLLLSSKNEQVKWFNPSTNEFESFAEGVNNALPYYLYIDSARQQVIHVQSDGFSYFSDLNSKKLLHKKSLAIKKIIRLDEKYNAFVSTGFVGFYCHKNEIGKKSIHDKYIEKLEHSRDGDFHFFRLEIDGRAKSVFFNRVDKKLYFISNVGVFRWEEGKIVQHIFTHFVPGVLNIRVWNGQEFALSIAGNLVELKSGRISKKNAELGKIQGIKQVITYQEQLFIRTNDKIWVFQASPDGKAEVYASFGLSNVECSDFTVFDKTVWILSTEGLVSWNFDRAQQESIAGLFTILGASVNGAKIASLNGTELPYNENNISIDFALLDFGLPTISELQYSVNNQRWETTDLRIRSLNFPALAAGDYAIQIRGMVDGKWIYFQTLEFQISPPFWSTIWFYLIVLVFITGLVVFYYHSKLRSNRVKNELINDKIILESNLNKSLLASIKSQMNPHFIFNALNTIQAYIYVNDKENATNYLSKFSKLTRSVLEMSEKDEIYLSEELSTLTLYLELEKMRFQDGFSYEFILNKTRPEGIKIPSMILQPYIENAIKHGLLHSTNKKQLTVSFHHKKNLLTVHINDNGIGRKKAEELRLKREEMHEGFSTKANEKRIDLLNATKEVSVQYADNYDKDGQAIGTTVTLNIHLNQ